MIKKIKGKWYVYDETGDKRLSKGYDSEDKAKDRLKQIERFKGNFVQVVNTVNLKDIRTERDDNGDEIIIIPSFTLPDDVVMNGGLYPADEIEKSYLSLEGTPAPIGHPQDGQGNFVSASSEIGVNRYQCGVFNGVVRRENGRVYVEKRINTRIARSINRGPELLQRLRDIMDGVSDDPIHTSTGIYLEPQYLDYERVSGSGKKYDWIARNMHFDHDAILLDQEGAATPDDGVGMMVNHGGVSLSAASVFVNFDADTSADAIQDALYRAARKLTGDNDCIHSWVMDWSLTESRAIVSIGGEAFETEFKLTDGEAEFTGDLVPVQRKVSWTPVSKEKSSSIKQRVIDLLKKISGSNGPDETESGQGGRETTTETTEDDEMSLRQKLLDKLKANSIAVPDGATDEQLVELAGTIPATNANQNGNAEVSELVANAIKDALAPVTEQMGKIETKLNEKDDQEKSTLVETLKANGFEDADLEGMSVNAMRKTAQKFAPADAYHVNSHFTANQQDDGFSDELPE